MVRKQIQPKLLQSSSKSSKLQQNLTSGMSYIYV